MQTKPYKDLYNLITALAGVGSFTNQEEIYIARFVNRRYLQAYNQSNNWGRYLVASEKRFFQPGYYEITFNPNGSATSPAADSITRKFYWVGMFNGTAAYSTINQESAEGGNPYIFYKDAGLYDGDFVIRQGSFTGGTKNIANPTATTAVFTGTTTTNPVLYQSIDVYGGGASIQSPEEEVPYGHLSSKWRDNDLNIPVEGNLVFKTFDNFIPFDENYLVSFDKKNTIGEFIKIYKDQALLKNSTIEYDFYINNALGAFVINNQDTDANFAYVTYKKIFEEIPPINIGQSQFSTNPVPEEFFPFIAHASYADFLRMDGQHQKALIEEQTAQGALDLELEQADIIANNNNATTRFSTYVSRQTR